MLYLSYEFFIQIYVYNFTWNVNEFNKILICCFIAIPLYCGVLDSCVLSSSYTQWDLLHFSLFFSPCLLLPLWNPRCSAKKAPWHKQIPFGGSGGAEWGEARGSSGNQLFVYAVRILFLARLELSEAERGKGGERRTRISTHVVEEPDWNSFCVSQRIAKIVHHMFAPIDWHAPQNSISCFLWSQF